MGQQFPPMAWAVPGLIPEGFGVIAAPPKAGKSWLALDIGLSIAAGLPALGVPTEPRPVLYCALEDSERRLQDRCRQLLGNTDIPEQWEYSTDPTTALDCVTDFARHHPDGFVILDTLQLVRDDKDRSKNDYGADYRFSRKLKDMAPERGSMLGVHHTRKAEATDFLDTISGTQGIAGAADFLIVLERPRLKDTGKIQVTGRDVQEAAYAVVFENGRWSPDGGDLLAAATKAQEQSAGDMVRAVAEFVTKRPIATTVHDIENAFKITPMNARQQLSRAHKKGLIARTNRGLYEGVTLSQPEKTAVQGT